jgi:hypothetical protein
VSLVVSLAALFGFGLAQRFSVYVLMPVTLLLICSIFGFEALHSVSLLRCTVAAIAATFALQIGFFFGVSLRNWRHRACPKTQRDQQV